LKHPETTPPSIPTNFATAPPGALVSTDEWAGYMSVNGAPMSNSFLALFTAQWWPDFFNRIDPKQTFMITEKPPGHSHNSALAIDAGDQLAEFSRLLTFY
jgi:hypothetical protein